MWGVNRKIKEKHDMKLSCKQLQSQTRDCEWCDQFSKTASTSPSRILIRRPISPLRDYYTEYVDLHQRAESKQVAFGKVDPFTPAGFFFSVCTSKKKSPAKNIFSSFFNMFLAAELGQVKAGSSRIQMWIHLKNSPHWFKNNNYNLKRVF